VKRLGNQRGPEGKLASRSSSSEPADLSISYSTAGRLFEVNGILVAGFALAPDNAEHGLANQQTPTKAGEPELARSSQAVTPVLLPLEQFVKRRRAKEFAGDLPADPAIELEAERAAKEVLEEGLEAAKHAATRLQAKLADLVSRRIEAQRSELVLRTDLDAARQSISALQKLLDIAVVTIDDADRRTEEAEEAWYSLCQELEHARSQRDLLELGKIETDLHADRLRIDAETAQSALADAEFRISELAAELAQRAEQIVRLDLEIESIRTQSSQTAERSSQAESRLEVAGVRIAELQAAVESAQSASEDHNRRATRADEDRALLQHELSEIRMKLDASVERASRAECGEAEGRVMLENVRDELEEVARDRDGIRASLTESRAHVYTLSVQLAELRGRVEEDERQIAQAGRYARHLENDLATAQQGAAAERERADLAEAMHAAVVADRALAADYLDDSNRRIREVEERTESILAQMRADIEAARKAASEACAARTTLEGEAATLRTRYEALDERLSFTERSLVSQTEETIAATQAESAQLATLIDVVQSSHFWKIKRWLKAIKGRLLGR
jgi:predicted  nucleic acid-binding Zn-ribbon protein